MTMSPSITKVISSTGLHGVHGLHEAIVFCRLKIPLPSAILEFSLQKATLPSVILEFCLEKNTLPLDILESWRMTTLFPHSEMVMVLVELPRHLMHKKAANAPSATSDNTMEQIIIMFPWNELSTNSGTTLSHISPLKPVWHLQITRVTLFSHLAVFAAMHRFSNSSAEHSFFFFLGF